MYRYMFFMLNTVIKIQRQKNFKKFILLFQKPNYLNGSVRHPNREVGKMGPKWIEKNFSF